MCNPGYNLVGTETRTCEQLDVDTADWSDAPPTCQRMYVHDSCIVVLKKKHGYCDFDFFVNIIKKEYKAKLIPY